MSSFRSSAGFWAVAMGAVGGAAGFFGPMIFNPDANQGPMLGIFITGPGGALAGFMLGLIFRVLPFGDAIRTQALTLCCTLLGLGTLWFSLPEPREVTRIVDASIARCEAASAVMPERIKYWDGRVAAVTWSPPRDNWRADTERMLRESPGVVVTLDIARFNAILEHRKPWSRGKLSARGWKNYTYSQDFYGGGTCESYPVGRQVRLAPASKDSSAWPPDDLPDFLGVQVLEPVPDEYARLIGAAG